MTLARRTHETLLYPAPDGDEAIDIKASLFAHETALIVQGTGLLVLPAEDLGALVHRLTLFWLSVGGDRAAEQWAASAEAIAYRLERAPAVSS